MATQNFVAGGFYGKLGDLVGQRWRNKRTLRQYVVPENPRTVPQQSNRGRFALAVTLAQQAKNINPDVPAWVFPDVGEFSARVGTAKNRLQLGLTEAQAVPLFPDGYVPEHTFSGVSLLTPSDHVFLSFQLTPTEPTRGRPFAVAIYCKDLLTGTYAVHYSSAFLSESGDTIFVSEIPAQFTPGADGWIEGASFLDGDYSDQAYFLPRTAVTESVPPTRAYSMTVTDIEWLATRVNIYLDSGSAPFEAIPNIWYDTWQLYDGEMVFVGDQEFTDHRLNHISENHWMIYCLFDPPFSDFPVGSYLDGKVTNSNRPNYNRSFTVPDIPLVRP